MDKIAVLLEGQEKRAPRVLDLGTQEGYDIATALRGPDTSDLLLKVQTTAVIRWLVGVRGEVMGASVRSPEDALSAWRQWDPEIRNEVRLVWEGESHFASHVKRVCKYLPGLLEHLRATVMSEEESGEES